MSDNDKLNAICSVTRKFNPNYRTRKCNCVHICISLCYLPCVRKNLNLRHVVELDNHP